MILRHHPRHAKPISSWKRNENTGCAQMMKVTPTETVMMQGTDATSVFKKKSVE